MPARVHRRRKPVNVIRNSLMAEPELGPLSGKVEADETYFNRSNRLSNLMRRPGRSPGAKTVFGMVERQGRVIVRHVSDATANT